MHETLTITSCTFRVLFAVFALLVSWAALPNWQESGSHCGSFL